VGDQKNGGADIVGRIETAKPADIGGVVVHAGGGPGVAVPLRPGDIDTRLIRADRFQDSGGPVIQQVHVHLVFWGNAWGGSPTPTAQQVRDAVQTLLDSPYMLGLSQYGAIGRGTLNGMTIFTATNPPNNFTDKNVTDFLTARMNDGTLPQPWTDHSRLYVVVMPQGINSSVAGRNGEHSFFTFSATINNFITISERTRFAWVTNDGTLSTVTQIFSHELVEAVTDPEGTAIVGVTGTCSFSGSWCEIGDICSTNDTVDGVSVQTYWSDEDGACIAPKRVLEISLQLDHCRIGMVVGGAAILDSSFGVSPSWIDVSNIGPLGGLTYAWTVTGANPVGPTNQPTLMVHRYAAGTPVVATVTATMPNGGTFTAEQTFYPMSQADANAKRLFCVLEDINDRYVRAKSPLSRIPTPDPPPWDEIEQAAQKLAEYARGQR
jgi:hypothetical protein